MDQLRVTGSIVDQCEIGDKIRVFFGKDVFVYELVAKSADFIDLSRFVIEPAPNPAPHQKYYSKFRKGWNR